MLKHLGMYGGLLGSLVVIVGCGGPAYQVAPVSGQVKLDGQPLANASVTFSPESSAQENPGGSGSFGRTDAEGRFTLKLIENDAPGAAVGRHKVSISQTEASDPSRDDVRVKDKVPAKYQGLSSELSFEVPAGGSNEANFDLKSR